MEIKSFYKNKDLLMVSTKGVILTKHNMLKRRWKGESNCCFCREKENIQHLFFEFHVAKFAWNTIFFAFGIKQLLMSLTCWVPG